MGKTCSSLINHQDAEKRSPTGCHVTSDTPRSNILDAPPEERASEPLDPFPLELMQLLVEEEMHTLPLPGVIEKFVCATIKHCKNLEDAEVLAIYAVLYQVMDPDHRVQAAKAMKDRGYPNEAISYLPSSREEPSVDMESLVAEIQKTRIKRWASSEEEFVEYTKFWVTKDLAIPLQFCKESLTNLLQALSSVAPDPSSKFGNGGMLDDTPSPDSLTLHWPIEGNLNRAEQEKAIYFFMTSNCSEPPSRIENIELHPLPPADALSLPHRLYSPIPCRIPGVRFIKVNALFTLKNLESIESLPAEAFTDTGHFAVSHGRDDKSMLERLQRVLLEVDGILPTDGVFVDTPRNELERLTSTVFVKAIFEQCHVIFLPPRDYFCHPRCMMECMSWFLSPFPNQALGDFDLGNCLVEISETHFGKPPFFLDRPELQWFGKMAMLSTDDDPHKEYYIKLLDYNRFKCTRLRESLTKVLFKLESAIAV